MRDLFPSFRMKPQRSLLLAALAVTSCVAGVHTAQAQVAAPAATGEAPVQNGSAAVSPLLLAALAPAPAAASSSSSESALPEAPQPQLHKLDTPPATPGTAQHVAPIYASVIPAGYRAQPQDTREKVIMGARDLYSLDSLAAIALSAGYEHVTDGEPNYGVNSKAFAQRLGAAAARETSQGVFTEMILAPLLHEDARYYVLGPSQNVVKRTFYAVTRPLITRSDSGRETVNGAQLLGYAGAAALTPLYYPQINRNFKNTAETYGASIGGAALGDFVSEFADDVLEALHLKRLP